MTTQHDEPANQTKSPTGIPSKTPNPVTITTDKHDENSSKLDTTMATPTKDQAKSHPKSTYDANKSASRPSNPYTMRKSEKSSTTRILNISDFIFIVDDFIMTIVSHDYSQTKTGWYSLWKEWLDEDILTATTLHMVSVEIDYPSNQDITIKRIALYILDKIPILHRYISIPGKTRPDDPLCHHTKPTLIGTQSQVPNPAPSNKTKVNDDADLTNQFLTKQANKSTTVSIPNDNNRYGILAENNDDTDDDIIIIYGTTHRSPN